VKIFRYILFFIGTIFLFGCAQIIAPSGGPKDTSAPVMIGANPPNGTTNFNADKITLEFNEFVKLNKVYEELLITPPLKVTPEVYTQGKKVIIKLKESLKPNKTYTFNFGSAIVDITEGNDTNSHIYVVSTGDFVDSLQFDGKIIDAFTLKPKEGLYVMLYENLSDSLPYLSKPVYASKTDNLGNFRLRHLSEGIYRIFALEDQNRNLLFDSQEERIGFLNEFIQPTIGDTIDLTLMYIFQEESPIQFIKEKDKSRYGRYIFTFNKPLSNPNVKYLFDTDSIDILSNISPGGDSITIWYNETFKEDTFSLIINDIDLEDTLNLPTIKADSTTLKPFNLLTRKRIKKFNFSKHFAIQFSHPAQITNSVKAVISDTIVDIGFLSDSGNPHKFFLDFDFEQYKEYQIFIEPGAFQDFYGRYSDTINIKLETEVQEHFGSLKLILEVQDSTNTENFLLELLNKDGKAIEKRRVNKKDTQVFNFLHPGTYSFRLIYDANNDGMWTTGDYLKGRQPEKIIYFIKKANIRSNWDLEEKWVIE